MDRRDRTAFNDLRKSLALGIAQQRRLARCLTIKESVRTSIIEPHDPVPHDLQRHSADTRRIAAAPAIINFRQSQKPTALVRALGHARRRFKLAASKSFRIPIAAPMAMPSNRQP
jgi:hypothetical protein